MTRRVSRPAPDNPVARKLAFDLIAAGATLAELREAMTDRGFHPATANRLLSEWFDHVERVEVPSGRSTRFIYRFTTTEAA
ncbi:hypothetical protein [Promicromonospora sp. NFX87]|uniref:hypothetical protein n=1 Tax=Promicromonospora sp. NFX87 TaxID=3402691 RepID=UPI003AFB001B